MRRVWQRSTACLLVLSLIVTCLSGFGGLSVSAENPEWKVYQDAIYYMITPQNEVTIKGARPAITETEIPAELDGCPVTEIAGYAFKDCTRLKRAVLPDSIRKIGEFAFMDCTRLEELVIPDTVTQIGGGIANGTPWLASQAEDFVIAGQGILLAYQGEKSSVTVPDSVRVIGGYAFDSCRTVQRVTLPASVQSIDGFAFVNCSNLQKIQLADGLEAIEQYAFHWCTSLTEIEMPDTVKTVGNHAFSYCKALRKVTLSPQLTQITNAMFQGCNVLEEITLPDSVTVIASTAFDGCAALQKLVLPETVEEIGAGAFSGCTGLQWLTVLNPACRISDTEQTLPKNVPVSSYVESTAHIFSQKYTHRFLPLDRMCGDINGDQEVNAMDVSLLLTYSAKAGAGLPAELDDIEQYCADYDENGIINAADASALLVYIAREGVGLSEAKSEEWRIEKGVLLHAEEKMEADHSLSDGMLS